MAPSSEEKSAPPDWGKIYSRVLYHTGMAYEEISRRTIPQIMAILDGAEENIPIRLGLPNTLDAKNVQGQEVNQNPSKTPTLSQFMNFANAFNT